VPLRHRRGFLIVPALIVAIGVPILYALGSSFLAVTAFGGRQRPIRPCPTLSMGSLAALFITGGVLGGLIGAPSANALAGRKGGLRTVFTVLIFAVAIYVLVRSLGQM
jgi:uncharacterized membrane protein YfcA